jgi:hypothetical protein
VILIQISRNFPRDVPVSKHRTCRGVHNILNVYSQPPHMISLVLDKFRDFQTSFEFYTIFKPFYLTIFIMITEPNIGNLASFHVHGIRYVS